MGLNGIVIQLENPEAVYFAGQVKSSVAMMHQNVYGNVRFFCAIVS